MNILLIGSGGREHALAWKLASSPHCDKLHCIPGNAGIAQTAICHDIDVSNHQAIIGFVKEQGIEFVVVGSEQPLVDGVGSALREAGVAVFGPSKKAAQLEGSKGYMKDFCARYDIPTAAYGRFTDFDTAKEFIEKNGAPIVLKTDGLAAGKGVIIAQTVEEALEAAKEMLSGEAFGEAGTELVIEEFLDGEELSYFVLADGENYLPLTSAQDHKRAQDGDTGPNTGGMGAYSPAHLMTPDLEQRILDTIIKPTVEGMKQDGTPFQGVLFAGIMVVNGAPKLLEYNIRFGDPECQPIMMRLESDLVELLLATDQGRLDMLKEQVKWSNDYTLCVVMAANGYPGSYKKNTVIKNEGKLETMEGVRLFHAGTVRGDTGELLSAGGRVLGVVGQGATILEAQERAYQGVDAIDWTQGFARRDIGHRAVAAMKDKAA
ncbi:MAG: phosphoribosylamine--glycine ligase [Alphaproteobacteria bacterium]|nr:phosphoribosylamine--glycine ligase [Alphaproteobacteria bacterium]